MWRAGTRDKLIRSVAEKITRLASVNMNVLDLENPHQLCAAPSERKLADHHLIFVVLLRKQRPASEPMPPFARAESGSARVVQERPDGIACATRGGSCSPHPQAIGDP